MGPETSFRWGVIGTGTIAGKFAKQLQKTPGAELYGVASNSQARADEFAKAQGFGRGYAPYEALLEDPNVDAVYIASRTPQHLAHCLLALDQGKPVLCEKPIALTRAEAERIFARACERRVFCMEAMWMRFHPLVQQLRTGLQEGRLGQMQLLQAELGWKKERERVERPELGRGAALDFGVYPLSFAHYLLGMPREIKLEVQRHPSGVDEAFSAELTYEGGCVARLGASLQQQLSNGATLKGNRGEALLHPPLLSPRGLQWFEAGQKRALRNRLLGALQPALSNMTIPPGLGFRLEAQELMDCVRAGRLQSEVVPHSATLAVMGWVDRIRAPLIDSDETAK